MEAPLQSIRLLGLVEGYELAFAGAALLGLWFFLSNLRYALQGSQMAASPAVTDGDTPATSQPQLLDAALQPAHAKLCPSSPRPNLPS